MENIPNFSGQVITPADAAYATAKDTISAVGSPAMIVVPQNNADIAAAIAFAREHKLILSIRSGGHSVAGFSTNDGGLVIDLSHFTKVDLIDKEKGLVRIGAGAKWIDAAKALHDFGLALSSGDTKTVGVGGLALGGGIGWMVRKFGLTIDSMVAAEVVTADGKVLRASETENADLFWALRGGGGNFGVVTNFEFAAHPITKVYSGSIIFGLENVGKIIKAWRDIMRNADDELTTIMNILPNFGGNPPMIALTVCYASDDKGAAMKAIDPLLSLDVVKMQNIAEKEYYKVLEEAHPPKGVKILVQSAFVENFSDEVIEKIVQGLKIKPDFVLQMRNLGGAMNRVPIDNTAFAHRTSEVLLLSPTFLSPTATDAETQNALAAWNLLSPYGKGSYAGFMSASDPESVSKIFPAATYARLLEIKKKYDPQNVFDRTYNVKAG